MEAAAIGADLENCEIFTDAEAYKFLLEVLCGLKSKVMGEGEIVAQFKKAMESHRETRKISSGLLGVLEKSLQDTKKVRREYLTHLGGSSYAGIVRKIILERFPAGEHVVIVGNGALSKDLASIIYKKMEVSICARNHQKWDQIPLGFEYNKIPFEQLNSLKQSPIIVNTVGTQETLFDHGFFETWSQALRSQIFLDLAEPSPIKTGFDKAQKVWRLQDILQHAQKQGVQDKSKIMGAQREIQSLSTHRSGHMGQVIPKLWEDLAYCL